MSDVSRPDQQLSLSPTVDKAGAVMADAKSAEAVKAGAVKAGAMSAASISAPAASVASGSRRRLRQEIGIVLLITFGMSGIRAALQLVSVYLSGSPSESKVVLNPSRATHPIIDMLLQFCSAGVLLGWGLLALYLLGVGLSRPRATDWGFGALLAACIGIPGLGLYVAGRALGLSREVIPATHLDVWFVVPLVVWAFANAFAEEVVVVWWLSDRLGKLGRSPGTIIVASALLRASYHLYQGIPAGVGNAIMGLIFAAVFMKWKKIWPLIVAHFLIDAVAFLGYPILVHFQVHIPGVV